MSLLSPESLQTLNLLWQIIVADIVLAGDNALVIALATRGLTGSQQLWGRIFGAGGAVLLRILFIILIGLLLRVPYLQLVGGLLLIWIALKLVRPQPEAIHEAAHHESSSKVATTLKQAITVIIVADVTMSFDNVVAIANIAKDEAGKLHVPLVVFGLLFSIPLVVWGSTFIAFLMEKFRWIVWLGGAVLAHVAGSIILHDRQVLNWMGADLTSVADTNKVALDGLSPGVATVIRVVPWVLAILLFIYGMCSDKVAAIEQGEPKQP